MTWATGDALDEVERTIGPADMVAYAGATWDWHRVHYDSAYTTEKGLAGPIVDGQALGAYLADQAVGNLGPGAFISRLSIRYRSLVFAGETIRCVGTVTSVDKGRIHLEQEVLVGERVAATARTVVRLDT